jgi:uncharacterized membrane protein
MFDPKLAVSSALVMLILEYTVLLVLYRRSPRLEKISLVVAPSMIIAGQYLAHLLQTYTDFFVKDRIDNVALFVAFALIELPLSIHGYEITPNASIAERVVVAATFGIASTNIAQAFIKN